MPIGDLQNHIHLGLTLTEGPEFAPAYSFPASDREPEYSAIMEVERTLTGRLNIHAISSGGSPIVFENYNYILKIDAIGSTEAEDRIRTILKPMLLKVVYFIDNYHVPDGQDHTPYVKQMALVKIGPLKRFDTMLSRFYLEIQLMDANTVP